LSLERQELDSYPTLAVAKKFYANDLADVFVVAEVGGRVIGECDEETYAFFVVLAVGKEVESSA
jgi:hypothetical protein